MEPTTNTEKDPIEEGFGESYDFSAEETLKSTPPSDLFQGAYLQRGRRRQTMMGKAMAVQGKIKKANAYSSVRARICMSASELNDTLNIKVSAGIGIDGIGSASAKFGMLNEAGVSGQDVVMVVYVKHIPWTSFAQDYRMKPNVKNDHMFGMYYGDRWVSKITEGSEFALVYNFKARTQSLRREILGSMQAKGVIPGANLNFDGSVESKIKQLMQRYTYTVKYLVLGISNPPYLNPLKDKVPDFIAKFLKTKPDAPQIVDMDFTNYNSVPR